GHGARLVEEAPRLTRLDSGDAADLEQRDARGELEHQGLAGLRNGGEERGDPTAVSHPIRRVTACNASARLLVPTCRLQALAGLVEVMGEEGGVRSRIRFVDREQGSRDGGVGPAPAIQKLCAVGDLCARGWRKAYSPGDSAGPRSSAVARRSSDAASSGAGSSTTARSSSTGTSRPTTAAAWSTSLSRSASRSMRE